jgi:adenylate cyclase
LQDIRTNALGQNVPGVSLHAQTVEQILSGHYLSRPDWANGLEIMAIATLGGLLVMLTVFVSPGVALVCGLLLTALSLVGSWLAFSTLGLLLDPLAPIVAGTITHFAVTSFRFLVTDRQRLAIRHAFGQYLSPALLHRIENTPDALRLGGDERELTVMFVDIRGFTSISEKLSPTGLVDFLNALLDALSRHVTDNEGTLDKFIGDSIMAFWNAPVDVEDHARKALRAALGMRRTLARLNAEDAFGFGDERAVAIGVGIHTGMACVGNMGAESRFNYSAVGDAVNIASRIESSCKEMACDILVSESTAAAAPDFAVLEAGELALRGRSGVTAVFAVVGDEQVAASTEFSSLRSQHGELVTRIRSRTQVDSDMVETAAAAGEKLEKGLARFFRRMVERPDHFRQS